MTNDTAFAVGPEGRPIAVPASYFTDLPQFFKPHEGDAGEAKHAAPATNHEGITEGPSAQELERAAALGVDPSQTVDPAPAEPTDEPPKRPKTGR